MKTPANMNPEVSFMLQETTKLFDPRIKGWLDEQLNKGWSLYAVNQTCGRCYYGPKFITMPLFAVKKGIAYSTWYLSHELSHSYAGHKANHGPEFMNWLKRICPVEFQGFEYGYKPRNALSAGVAIRREELF